MVKYFERPFASSGNRESIPTEVQASGEMSLEEGYTYDYERNPLKDDKARSIERAKMNQLFYLITEAIGELQKYGSSNWVEERMPYPEGVVVFYNNKTWVSKKANNEDKPGITDSWKDISKETTFEGDEFDSKLYFTKEEVKKVITDAISNIDIPQPIQPTTAHENGEIYTVSRTSLVENEYICNGTTFPIESKIGKVLNNLLPNYKDAWGVEKFGDTLIKLPYLIGNSSLPDSRVVYGMDKEPGKGGVFIYNGQELISTGTAVKEPWAHIQFYNFIPIIYLDTTEITDTSGNKCLLETVNYSEITGKGMKVSSLEFGLYTNGETADLDTYTLGFDNGSIVSNIYDVDGRGVYGSYSQNAKVTNGKGLITIRFSAPLEIASIKLNLNVTATKLGSDSITFSNTQTNVFYKLSGD